MDFNSIEQNILSDFDSILTNNQIDQRLIIQTLTKLIFCIFKQISQIPTLFSDLKKELQNIINQLTDKNGQSIHSKLEHFQESIQDQVYKWGGKIIKRKEGFEPNIFTACVSGDLESVRWLIEEGHVDEKIKYNLHIHGSSSRDDIGYDTPIQYAAESGQLEIVRYLVEQQGVDVNTVGALHTTPLHGACREGHLPIVKYLISKGANIEARGEYKMTPLHEAVDANNSDIIRYLLEQGADKFAKDSDGQTPYDHIDLGSTIDKDLEDFLFVVHSDSYEESSDE